jgi:hypothetical protein
MISNVLRFRAGDPIPPGVLCCPAGVRAFFAVDVRVRFAEDGAYISPLRPLRADEVALRVSGPPVPSAPAVVHGRPTTWINQPWEVVPDPYWLRGSLQGEQPEP